jgi:hypothetical protein
MVLVVHDTLSLLITPSVHRVATTGFEHGNVQSGTKYGAYFLQKVNKVACLFALPLIDEMSCGEFLKSFVTRIVCSIFQ